MDEQCGNKKLQKRVRKYKKIEDLELIKKYDSMDLYIPPHEIYTTFDSEMLNRHAFADSKKVVGEHRPIEVAIWEEDPEKNSPNAWHRIHLRIINGRHRYSDNPKWKREYYDLSEADDPVLIYYDLRLHFDMQKKSKPEERTALIEQLGEYLMKEKVVPMNQVCQTIVEMWVPQGIASDVTIRNSCPEKFKDLKHVFSRKGKTFEETGQQSKSKKTIREMGEEKLKIAEEKMLQERKQKEDIERNNVFLRQSVSEKKSLLGKLQKQLKKIKSLETTVDIEGIRIHVRVDSVFEKLIVEKAK